MRMIREAWGKTDRDGGGVHPLAHHCMDVAAVFGRMMELPIIRNRLETAAKAPLSDVDRRRLAALVFLHDIGKLHPGFQAKGWLAGSWSGPVRGHSKEAWAFLMLALKRHEHPFHETMQRIMGWGEAVGPLVAAIIAHHGRPVERPLRRFAPWTAAGRSGRRGCLRGKGDVPASAGPDQRVRTSNPRLEFARRARV